MELPKFILGDNTDFPRFILNLENDDVEWLEEFDDHDEKELESEVENLIQQATDFYDREIARYNE